MEGAVICAAATDKADFPLEYAMLPHPGSSRRVCAAFRRSHETAFYGQTR